MGPAIEQKGRPQKARPSESAGFPASYTGVECKSCLVSASWGLPEKRPGMFPCRFACCRVHELRTPRPSSYRAKHIHTHIHSNHPLRLGICIVETAAKGTACLGEREREKVKEGREREHWGEGR